MINELIGLKVSIISYTISESVEWKVAMTLPISLI